MQVWRGTTAHTLVKLCGADTYHVFIPTSNKNTQQTSNIGKITDIVLYLANVEDNASKWQMGFNPLNVKLNPICHLLALI